MSQKIGPREQQLREMGERRFERSQADLQKLKAKVASIPAKKTKVTKEKPTR